MATPLPTVYCLFLSIYFPAMAYFKHQNPDYGIFYPDNDSVVAYAILPELTQL